MKKLLMLLGMIIFLASIISGCESEKRDPNTAIDLLKSLNSYTCDIKMEIKNDKQTLNYNLIEYYKSGIGFRLDLEKERVFLFKDDKTYVKDLKSGAQYIDNKDSDNIFKLCNLEEYISLLYTDENIKFSYKNENGKNFEIVGLVIPGGNKDTSCCELYLDMGKNIPERLYIYDSSGKEKIKIVFENFNPEVKLDNGIFNIT